MDRIVTLWRGALPLAEAFWTWTLVGGLVVNVTTSVLFLWLITIDLVLPAMVVGYGISLPYNLLVLVGVWRSAARHDGPVIQADMARMASVIVIAVLSIT